MNPLPLWKTWNRLALLEDLGADPLLANPLNYLFLGSAVTMTMDLYIGEQY
jgi:hypothetical protein